MEPQNDLEFCPICPGGNSLPLAMGGGGVTETRCGRRDSNGPLHTQCAVLVALRVASAPSPLDLGFV